ncbi:MAG: YggS family pyridoxal phosphate-dependent enzyme [Planctomycetota bacterium]|jgi:pyridoxal phosphate enzyme (YggS family)
MQTTSSEHVRSPRGGDSLADRYESVRQRIATAARRAGRRPEDIVLVAVTKFASIDEIRELADLGHVDFGESRVQNLIQRAAQMEEYLQRQRDLRADRSAPVPESLRWHMIGSLQRNKVRKLLGKVRLIHSVDSLRLAEEIQASAAKLEDPVEVLVQVNASGEKSKHGIVPAAARHLVEQIDTMMNLRPRGLMCMAALADDPESARPAFTLCRETFDDIRRSGVGGERFDILSMGMTHDFEVAIECGANVVRIGSAIFGSEDGAAPPP